MDENFLENFLQYSRFGSDWSPNEGKSLLIDDAFSANDELEEEFLQRGKPGWRMQMASKARPCFWLAKKRNF